MDSYHRPRDEPNKNLIIIPLMFLFVGLILTYFHPILSTGFIGMVLSLAGVLVCFVSGMIYADMWSSSRRLSTLSKTKDSIEKHDGLDGSFYDPFENQDELDEEEL